jgi:hypothetical protein
LEDIKEASDMAKEGMFGDLISLGLLAVGGYLLYNWWTTSQASAAAQTAATGTPAPPPPPAYQYTPPAASQQLQNAAASNDIVKAQGGQADAYQWATIYNGISGLPSISSVDINATFFPNGLPATQTPNAPGMSQGGLPLMSAQLFIQGLTAAGIKGLSGFGQAPRMIPVPVILTHTKRTINIPAGTTPAELQARLRSVHH